MGHRYFRMVIAFSAAVSVSGCEGMSDGEQTVAEGAALLGVLAGGITAMTGGSSQDIQTAAAWGALAGGAAGAVIASRKAEYASRAAMLSGENAKISRQISRASAASARMQSENRRMKTALATHNAAATSAAEKKRLASAGRSRKAGELSRARSALAATDKELKVTSLTLADARRTGSSAAELSAWEAKIASLKSERRVLAREIDAYSASGWRL